MCGIVGVISTEINTSNHSYTKFFQQALFTDTLRGFDSTGIFLVDDKDKDPEVFKKALAAPDFLQLKRSKDLLRDYNDWTVMVGHNRAATKGGVNHDTAHPFQSGGITLVHNGTVYNHRALPGGEKFDVDSEAITHAIAEQGIDEVVAKLDGAFALIYWDNNDGTLNIVRNNERPLALGQVTNRETILMSSESMMLRWISMRNGMSLESVVEPKPGELFTFRPDKDNKNWIAEATSRTLKLRQKYNGHNYANNGNGASNKTGGSGKKGEASGGNVTKMKGGSTPSGNSSGRGGARESALALIASVGLEYKDMVVLSGLMWQPYHKGSNNSAGLVGFVTGQVDDLDMKLAYGMIHNVTKTEFDAMRDNYVYSELSGAAADAQGNTILYLDNQDYYTIEPEELPEHSTRATTVDYEDADDDAMEKGGKTDTVKTFRVGDNEFVTSGGFAQLTAKGCSECEMPIAPEDHEKTGWTESKRPICKSCVRDLGLTQYLR